MGLIKSSAEARIQCYQKLSENFKENIVPQSKKEKECQCFCSSLADDLQKIPDSKLLRTKIKILQIIQDEIGLCLFLNYFLTAVNFCLRQLLNILMDV